MKRIATVLALTALTGCAHAAARTPAPEDSDAVWLRAHEALAATDFVRADSLFTTLTEHHPETRAAREALFYRGAIRLDPRNPSWDPAPAETYLRRYLDSDSLPDAKIHRRPEAETFYQLALQLNLPGEERVPALQPETKVVTKVVPKRVVVPAAESRELAATVERLRAELAERDARIRRQQEELERIRKTLTGGR